jgi:hypothetical protein
MFQRLLLILQRATLAEKEVNTLKEQLTTTATSKTQTNATLSNSTTTTTITQNGTSPPSPSTTPLSLLSDNNDNHSNGNGNKLLNNNSIKSCHLDDENMDKKMNDVEEMIDQSREDDDDVKDTNNHCSSSRSTPTSEKQRKHHHDDDDDDVNGDRCSVKSSSVHNSTVSRRTMAEELALKDKEVSKPDGGTSIIHLPHAFDVLIPQAPFVWGGWRKRKSVKIFSSPDSRVGFAHRLARQEICLVDQKNAPARRLLALLRFPPETFSRCRAIYKWSIEM